MVRKSGRPPISATVQQDILRRHARGETDRHISGIHGLSISTVRKYRLDARRDDAIRAAPAAALSAAQVKDLESLVQLLPKLQVVAQLGDEEVVGRLKMAREPGLTASEIGGVRAVLAALRKNAGSVEGGASQLGRVIGEKGTQFTRLLLAALESDDPKKIQALASALVGLYISIYMVKCNTCQSDFIILVSTIGTVKCPECAAKLVVE